MSKDKQSFSPVTKYFVAVTTNAKAAHPHRIILIDAEKYLWQRWEMTDQRFGISVCTLMR